MSKLRIYTIDSAIPCHLGSYLGEIKTHKGSYIRKFEAACKQRKTRNNLNIQQQK